MKEKHPPCVEQKIQTLIEEQAGLKSHGTDSGSAIDEKNREIADLQELILHAEEEKQKIAAEIETQAALKEEKIQAGRSPSWENGKTCPGVWPPGQGSVPPAGPAGKAGGAAGKSDHLSVE